MLGELTETQIKNLLSSQVLGRLACSDGEQPYIIPLTYTYNGEYLYGQTNEGEKLKILRKNPKVCFEVDSMSDMANWQSVLVYGTFQELTDEEAEKARAILFSKIFLLMTSSTVHVHEHDENTEDLDDSARIKQIMYRIHIEKMTGRFEKRHQKS